MRTGMALLAAFVCGVLALGNFAVFAILVITKAVILFTGWRPITAIVIFGANAGALAWLATQAWRSAWRPRAAALPN